MLYQRVLGPDERATLASKLYYLDSKGAGLSFQDIKKDGGFILLFDFNATYMESFRASKDRVFDARRTNLLWVPFCGLAMQRFAAP
jgi:hypothetical protein